MGFLGLGFLGLGFRVSGLRVRRFKFLIVRAPKRKETSVRDLQIRSQGLNLHYPPASVLQLQQALRPKREINSQPILFGSGFRVYKPSQPKT